MTLLSLGLERLVVHGLGVKSCLIYDLISCSLRDVARLRHDNVDSTLQQVIVVSVRTLSMRVCFVAVGQLPDRYIDILFITPQLVYEE